MKKFLIYSISLLVFAVIITVVVFFYLTRNPTSVDDASTAVTDVINKFNNTSSDAPKDVAKDILSKVPVEGIPLSSLPLSEAQKKTLETANIDVSTYTLTPAMISCGAEKLGAPRLDAIIGGSAPSVIEVAKLLPCLSEKTQ